MPATAMTGTESAPAGRRAIDSAIDEALATTPPAPRGFGELERFEYSRTVQRHLHGHGLVGLEWPAEYGGRNLDPADAVHALRRLAGAGIPELANYVAIDVLSPALIEFMPAAKLRRWLPPMAEATEIWCQMFSEPDAGSDLASLRTQAVRTDAGWLVNGQKVWSTWAHYAQWGVLLARTGTTESRHRGITAFVVDMASDGILTRPIRTMTGTAHFSEVFFTDVVLPADAVIGEIDGGWGVAMKVLEHERGAYPASRAAILRRALAAMLDHVGDRRDAEMSTRIGRIQARLNALDALVDIFINRLAAGRRVGPDAATAKLLLSRTEQLLFDTFFEVLGPDAVMWDGVEELPLDIQEFLYSVAATIYGGARNIQLNLIGERRLGLAR
jgi:alkylation response protein AidB-like acyl-CoA dehydrogenase